MFPVRHVFDVNRNVFLSSCYYKFYNASDIWNFRIIAANIVLSFVYCFSQCGLCYYFYVVVNS